jgi:uncharacterized protein YyaL (SSP411 family)
MPNRLAGQTSPYLLQHADNPVEWYPWGEEALARARSEDKPVLLSIGYSACHWCHVMAHESFENAEVAAEMNRLFVNVKVDREERPDLDQIYQLAHAMLTRRGGGWPLTMFLMPDGTPFFAGTYFPRTPRHGMPGFLDLLPKIADAYRERREDIAQQNTALMAALGRMLPAAASDTVLDGAPLDAALRELAQLFDGVHGGIGRAPKFPHPCELAWCLRRHALAGGDSGLEIARVTLVKMAEGGIYDQIGGGFCRYSVDQYWSIPHFEKMLYDNALLLALYSDAWLVTRLPLFESVVRDTVRWLAREMAYRDRQHAGAFCSSLDADSEHEEGKFYVWNPAEVRALLTPEEYAVVEQHYGLDGAPNFESTAWHLRIAKPLEVVAEGLALSVAECAARLAAARGKLLAAREKRVRPGRDDKVLTSWNALAIKGLARASRVFGEPGWLAAAQGALEFVRTVLWRNGRLAATYKDGVAHLNAYLDDHAFLLDALIELMQCDFRDTDLAFARELADILVERFEDRASGGFYFVSHDHETLIHRAKSGQDGATPSGNGIAALALARLGHLVGEPRYLDAAERTLKLFDPALKQQASGFVSLATALDEYLAPPTLVILRGERAAVAAWQRTLAAVYRPATLVVGIPSDAKGLPAVLDKPAAGDGAVNAWVCRGVSCLPPVADAAALERVLAERAG